MKPIRIQRKRTKGWKMPPNTAYVGRGSKWGNPFKVVKSKVTFEIELLGKKEHEMYWVVAFDGARCTNATELAWHGNKEKCIKVAVSLFKNFRTMSPIRNYPTIKEIKKELKGKNLACWCSLDQPCHADVLLELANKEE